MTPVRLEPAAPRSRVKHSTTEPLRSLKRSVHLNVLLNIYKQNITSLSFLVSTTVGESYFARGDFCRLLITFANNLAPDQNRRYVGPDLEPNSLTLR